MIKRDENSIKYILDTMSPYIHNRGEEIVNDEENLKDPNTFTLKLLQLKEEVDDLVSYAFDDGMLF